MTCPQVTVFQSGSDISREERLTQVQQEEPDLNIRVLKQPGIYLCPSDKGLFNPRSASLISAQIPQLADWHLVAEMFSSDSAEKECLVQFILASEHSGCSSLASLCIGHPMGQGHLLNPVAPSCELDKGAPSQ